MKEIFLVLGFSFFCS